MLQSLGIPLVPLILRLWLWLKYFDWTSPLGESLERKFKCGHRIPSLICMCCHVPSHVGVRSLWVSAREIVLGPLSLSHPLIISMFSDHHPGSFINIYLFPSSTVHLHSSISDWLVLGFMKCICVTLLCCMLLYCVTCCVGVALIHPLSDGRSYTLTSKRQSKGLLHLSINEDKCIMMTWVVFLEITLLCDISWKTRCQAPRAASHKPIIQSQHTPLIQIDYPITAQHILLWKLRRV